MHDEKYLKAKILTDNEPPLLHDWPSFVLALCVINFPKDSKYNNNHQTLARWDLEVAVPLMLSLFFLPSTSMPAVQVFWGFTYFIHNTASGNFRYSKTSVKIYAYM
jgi:hypothetical protein